VGKMLGVVLIVAAATGLGYFFTHYEVLREEGRFVIRPRPGAATPESPSVPGIPPTWKSIRVASFDASPLDQRKLRRPLGATRLAELIRDHDIVALQGIEARHVGVLRELVDQVNSAGRTYDFAVPPELATQEVDGYVAFVFDRARIDLDRSTVGSVADPGGQFPRKPLVGLFRARGPEPDQAFTFTLVNVRLDPDQAAAQLDLLGDVYKAVAEAYPGEDDVILLGNFAADQRELGRLGRIPGASWAVTNTVSTTRGTGLVDNIVFNRRATCEFLGRAGVVDLIRRLNVDLAAALAVAEHMPVWAEFSIYEGGQIGAVARTPE